MKHDFTPEPHVDGARQPASQNWLPEMIAIVGIFLVVWIVFALHFLAGGGTW